MRNSAPIRFEAKTTAFILADDIKAKVEGIVETLNPEQKDAVLTVGGPVLVEAGAGTGKTKVLTSRIARLIARGDAVPERILAVTFTNKAASEMRERLGHIIGQEAASEVCMGSFHAVSLAMLRRHASEAGLRNDEFRIFDDGDQLLAMHAAMLNAGLSDQWRKPGSLRRDRSDPWNQKANLLLEQVQSWKDEGRTVADVETEVTALRANNALDPAIEETALVYRHYQAELVRRNAVDFADIILLMVDLFRRSPSVKAHWAARFSYILVDEFQDTDGVQYEWLTALAEGHRNIFAVGDLDQCIYEWRNANPAIFSGFPADWPGCKSIRLHRNYRSTQPILDVASEVVEKSRSRGSRTRLASGTEGGAVELLGFDTAIDEAQWIADDIAKRIAGGTPLGQIAVLFRQAKDMPTIEQALVSAAVPYAVVSGVRFHKREEVKDILAWVAIATDQGDEIALLRASQRPAWGIDEQTFARAMIMIRNGMPSAEALRMTAGFDQFASQASRDGLDQMATAMEALVTEKGALGALVRRVLDLTGYVAWRRRAGLAEEDLEDIVEALLREADEFDGTAGEFLQMFALLADADSPSAESAVRLSTIHAAKGLEFDVVYTPCLEEGIIPNDRSLKHERFIEEERRILHVAWTRAKQHLVPSFARSRRYKPSEHSRFLIDAELFQDHHKSAASVAPRSTNRYATTKTIRRIRISSTSKP